MWKKGNCDVLERPVLSLSEIKELESYHTQLDMLDAIQAQVRLQALRLNRMLKLQETESMKQVSNQMERETQVLRELCDDIAHRSGRNYEVISKPQIRQ